MIYSVINMDIVDSRKLKNRVEIQDVINTYLDEVSHKYRNILLSKITLTLGDEWQIVLKDISKSYTLITEINEFLIDYNIKTYSGIGLGSISTGIYSKSSLMDGEAFINAREALNKAKKKNGYINSNVNRVYFNEAFDNTYEEVALTSINGHINNKALLKNVINSLIENTEIIINRITPKQLEIIKSYRSYGTYSSMVENQKAKSKAEISQKLNTAEYFVLENNIKLIEKLFIEYKDLIS